MPPLCGARTLRLVRKLSSAFNRLAWSNLAAQSAEQVALAAAPMVAVLALGAGAGETGLLQTAQQALDDVGSAVGALDRPELRGPDDHTEIFQRSVAPNSSRPWTFLRNAPGTTNWPHGT